MRILLGILAVAFLMCTTSVADTTPQDQLYALLEAIKSDDQDEITFIAENLEEDDKWILLLGVFFCANQPSCIISLLMLDKSLPLSAYENAIHGLLRGMHLEEIREGVLAHALSRWVDAAEMIREGLDPTKMYQFAQSPNPAILMMKSCLLNYAVVLSNANVVRELLKSEAWSSDQLLYTLNLAPNLDIFRQIAKELVFALSKANQGDYLLLEGLWQAALDTKDFELADALLLGGYFPELYASNLFASEQAYLKFVQWMKPSANSSWRSSARLFSARNNYIEVLEEFLKQDQFSPSDLIGYCQPSSAAWRWLDKQLSKMPVIALEM